MRVHTLNESICRHLAKFKIQKASNVLTAKQIYVPTERLTAEFRMTRIDYTHTYIILCCEDVTGTYLNKNKEVCL